MRIRKARGQGHSDGMRVNSSTGRPAGHQGKVMSGSSEDSTGGRHQHNHTRLRLGKKETENLALDLATQSSEVLSDF